MIVDLISIDINPLEGSLVRHLWAPSTQGWANGFRTFLGHEAARGDQQQHDTPRTGCVRFPCQHGRHLGISRPFPRIIPALHLAVSGANANPQRGHVDFHGLKPRCRWPRLACPTCFGPWKKSLRCRFVCWKPHFCWVLLNKLEIVAPSLSLSPSLP